MPCAAALARARALHSAYSEAGVQVNLGMSRLLRLHYDEAIPYFERAAALAGPQFSNALLCRRGATWRSATRNLGEHDRALEIHLQSVAQNERSGAKLVTCRIRSEKPASTTWSKGDPKAAIPYLERALSLASEANRTADAAIWAGNLSECYSELRDWQNAASFNQEAIRLKTAANMHTLYYNVLNAARIAGGRGDPAEAARLYQQAIDEGKADPAVVWEAQAGLGAVALQQHRPAAAVQHFEAAVDLLEKTRADVVSTELKLPFLTQRISLYQQYVETLIDQGESDRALAVADSSRAQVLAGHAGSIAGGRLPAEAFRAIARQNGARPALLLAGSRAVSRVGGECAGDPPCRTAAGGGDRRAGARIPGRHRAAPGRSPAHADRRGRAPLPVTDRAGPPVDTGGVARHSGDRRGAARPQSGSFAAAAVAARRRAALLDRRRDRGHRAFAGAAGGAPVAGSGRASTAAARRPHRDRYGFPAAGSRRR